MRKKQIKTFSVDEDIYNELVEIFRKSESEVSLSSFVDKCLKDLHRYIKHIEKNMKKSNRYTVPMSFIIGEVVKAPIISLYDEVTSPGVFQDVTTDLDEWQTEFDARNMKMPRAFYQLVRTGKFELSPDRKYVINLKNKVKYMIDKDGELAEVREDGTLMKFGLRFPGKS
jgi:hypothetical protein